MSKEEMTKKHFVGDATADASLGDVNGSVEVPTNGSFWRKLWAFSGPGALVAVGYMDLGDISSGWCELPLHAFVSCVGLIIDCNDVAIHGW